MTKRTKARSRGPINEARRAKGPPYLSLLRRDGADWVAVIYARRGPGLWLCARVFGSDRYVARAAGLGSLLVTNRAPRLTAGGSDRRRALFAQALAGRGAPLRLLRPAVEVRHGYTPRASPRVIGGTHARGGSGGRA